MYAGDKLGGTWLSPTSRVGTGGSLYPLVSFTSCYYSELHGCCGQTEWQSLELVCPILDVKSQIFPGLFLYWYMEVGILDVY